jgi:hypothetical protein
MERLLGRPSFALNRLALACFWADLVGAGWAGWESEGGWAESMRRGKIANGGWGKLIRLLVALLGWPGRLVVLEEEVGGHIVALVMNKHDMKEAALSFLTLALIGAIVFLMLCL